MNSVQIEQKSYEMPPREGISIAQFLTVADIERSARYYEKVFGARILSLGDGNAPGYLQLANIWMILNVGGGPTPDKPTVTVSVPDPNHINSFMNFRVADIKACYELWKSRGAEFITEPIPKYGETRCYIRDRDGYVIDHRAIASVSIYRRVKLRVLSKIAATHSLLADLHSVDCAAHAIVIGRNQTSHLWNQANFQRCPQNVIMNPMFRSPFIILPSRPNRPPH